MAIDANEAAQLIVSEVMADDGAGDLREAGVDPDFCSIWKKVRPILQTIVDFGLVFLKPIGIGRAALRTIRALIKIGDRISAEVCH